MRALAVLLAGLAACGGPRSQPPHQVMTGDPLPASRSAAPACDDNDGYRWLATDPHVPLAITGAGEIASAEACCAAWGHAGDEWTEVDAWGAPIATRTVTGGEGYDVTQCYELTIDGEDAPSALLVRGAQPWHAPASAQWIPDDAERASLLALAATFDVAFTPPAHGGASPSEVPRPLAERVVFFAMAGDDGDPEVTTRFAAIGGRALVIAGLDATGVWRVHHLDAGWGISAGPWLAEPYRIVAVFDIDLDGYPEVIVHRSDGPSWDDAILKCSPDSTLRPWNVAAESVGGSTA